MSLDDMETKLMFSAILPLKKVKEIFVEILIADTNSEMIENVRITLNINQPDWNLSIIDSGKQCLDMVKNGSCPYIVILGMELSDMSGFELIEKIRDYSDVPVVFFSDNNDIQILVRAFDSGANDYIVWPFNKTIFVARLKAMMRRRDWDIQSIEKKLASVNDKQNICS